MQRGPEAATGLTEAMVFIGNTLMHSRRDPSNITGWSCQPIATPFLPDGCVGNAAVATGSAGKPALMAVGDTDWESGAAPYACIMSLTSATTWEQTQAGDAGASSSPTAPLQAGTTGAGEVHF